MLTKILGRFMRSTSKDTDGQRAVQNLPKYQQAHLLVDKIAARKGRPFSPITAARVELQVIDPDILSLSARIRGYAERLELSDGLTPKDCFTEVKTVTLDKFFTDTNGHYIPLDTLADFLEDCRRLLKIVERGLDKKDRNVEYSVRLMGKCFSSIHNVCKAVEEAAP